jgi:effector-binding domain-containing protein
MKAFLCFLHGGIMFKIGEFARIGRTPVTTLRFYDEVGLLKPAHVDEATSYRYYTLEQLPRLNRILALRDLGLSMEQIAQLLQETVAPELVRQILDLKQAELRQRVQEEQERLARVEVRLRQIDEEGRMSAYDMVLKPVEAVRVASVRTVVPTYRHIDEVFQEIATYIGQHGGCMAGPGIAVWYDRLYREHDPDGEAAFPLQGALPESERIKVKDLPAVEMVACTVHKGSFSLLTQAYAAIFTWVRVHGYQVSGPLREVYLCNDPNENPDAYLTEVQLPVSKG